MAKETDPILDIILENEKKKKQPGLTPEQYAESAAQFRAYKEGQEREAQLPAFGAASPGVERSALPLWAQRYTGQAQRFGKDYAENTGNMLKAAAKGYAFGEPPPLEDENATVGYYMGQVGPAVASGGSTLLGGLGKRAFYKGLQGAGNQAATKLAGKAVKDKAARAALETSVAVGKSAATKKAASLTPVVGKAILSALGATAPQAMLGAVGNQRTLARSELLGENFQGKAPLPAQAAQPDSSPGEQMEPAQPAASAQPQSTEQLLAEYEATLKQGQRPNYEQKRGWNPIDKVDRFLNPRKNERLDEESALRQEQINLLRQRPDATTEVKLKLIQDKLSNLGGGKVGGPDTDKFTREYAPAMSPQVLEQMYGLPAGSVNPEILKKMKNSYKSPLEQMLELQALSSLSPQQTQVPQAPQVKLNPPKL